MTKIQFVIYVLVLLLFLVIALFLLSAMGVITVNADSANRIRDISDTVRIITAPSRI